MKVVVIAGSLSAVLGVLDPFIPNVYGFLVGRFLLAFVLNVAGPPLYVLGKSVYPGLFSQPFDLLPEFSE